MSSVHPIIHDALNLDGKPETLKAYYHKWALQYDEDLANEAYAAPQIVVELFLEVISAENRLPAHPKIIDAGCGTGLVGRILHENGYRHIDGFDLSPTMVAQAVKLGVYTDLQGNVDLNLPLPQYAASSYDVVFCCGVFTLGHVPAAALNQLIYLCKAGGLIITSTRTAYYDASDYQATVDQLELDRKLKLLQNLRDAPYTTDGNSHYWVYRCLK